MDDDFQLVSPLEQSSSPVHDRKLKRLKKVSSISSDDVIAKPVSEHVLASSEVLESNEEPLRFEAGKELDSGFVEEGSGSGSEGKNGEDPGGEQGEEIGDRKVDESFDSEGQNEESLQFNLGRELNYRFDEDRPSTKRVLEFGGDGEDSVKER